MNNKTKQITAVAVMIAVIVVANLLDKAYSFGLVAINGAALAVCALIACSLLSMVWDNPIFAIISGAMFGLVSFTLSFIFSSPIFQNPLISILPRCFIGIAGYGMYKLMQIVSKYMMSFAKKLPIHFGVMIAVMALTVAGLVVFCIFAKITGWLFFLLIAIFALLLAFELGFMLALIAAKKDGGDSRSTELFALTVGTIFVVFFNTALVLTSMYLFQELIGKVYGAYGDVFAGLSLINFLPEVIITAIAAPYVILGVRRGMGLRLDGKPKYKNIKNTSDIGSGDTEQNSKLENYNINGDT